MNATEPTRLVEEHIVRRYQRLLRAYPRSWRQFRETEMLGMLVESLAAGVRWTFADAANLVMHGVLMRARAYGSAVTDRARDGARLGKAATASLVPHALMSALALLAVSILMAFTGARVPSARYVGITQVLTSSASYDGGTSIPIAELAVSACVLGAVGLRMMRLRVAPAVCCAAGGVLAIGAWLAGQSAVGVVVAAFCVLAGIGVLSSAPARRSRGAWVFLLLIGAALAHHAGLFGTRVEVSVLNWLVPAGDGIVAAVMILGAAVLIGGAASRRVAVVSVGLLAIGWYAALPALFVSVYPPAVIAQILGNGAVAIGAVVVVAILVGGPRLGASPPHEAAAR
ncbi:hypothetical protein CLV47_102222 [Antricoccus suffuscus]|uniref:Uncharacterized protein n=1 Tax=Antricoccus suffuscus TaxID=1629062 RepID=A0A2T1A4Q8_9ACTN|nr:hypothetical protein [Antricoccus suffuscus]PRZ43534.1 hypothetical protein CLV47_102222 [Antricoccus suffuscus]